MEGHKRRMRWTVANVRRPLIAATSIAEAGNEIILGKNPRIVNCKTGQITKLRKEGGVYVVDIWIHVGNAEDQGGGSKGPGFYGRR